MGGKKQNTTKVPEKIKQSMLKPELVKVIHMYRKCEKLILLSPTLISNNCAARIFVAKVQMLVLFVCLF